MDTMVHADTHTYMCWHTVFVRLLCSLSSFWKVVSSEGRGNWKSHRYWSGRKHGLTTGTDIRNNNYTVNSQSCCRSTFCFCWLDGTLMCLLIWRRWLSLESSSKEGFLVNYFIMLNRQFPNMTMNLIFWLYVQGIKYNLLCFGLITWNAVSKYDAIACINGICTSCVWQLQYGLVAAWIY